MSIRLTTSARNSLLAIGAVLALFSTIKSDADDDLATTHEPVSQIPATRRRSAIVAKKEAQKHTPPRKDLLIGDRSLRGQLKLDKRRLVRGHYQIKLADGSRAVLTLDPSWQEAAERVLSQAKAPQAAIVVMQTDGKLLALAGSRYQNNSQIDDFRQALQSWAPAASIFKIVTATALLRAGVSSKKKACYHGGVRSIEAGNLIDNSRADTTCNTLEYALAKSQNALIAKLATKYLKRDSLQATALKFGFTAAPDFALEAQAPRLELPVEPLAFARVAAGFWHSELSPVSAALLVNTIASGGRQVSPRIVAEVHEKTRTIPVVTEAPKRVLTEGVAKAVASMMTATTRYGTAKKAFHDRRGRPFLKGIKVAGKTGSLSRTNPSYLGYSWFVGFAPASAPQVVIVVLLGNPAKWYLKAHTAARLVLESHF